MNLCRVPQTRIPLAVSVNVDAMFESWWGFLLAHVAVSLSLQLQEIDWVATTRNEATKLLQSASDLVMDALGQRSRQ